MFRTAACLVCHMLVRHGWSPHSPLPSLPSCSHYDLREPFYVLIFHLYLMSFPVSYSYPRTKPQAPSVRLIAFSVPCNMLRNFVHSVFCEISFNMRLPLFEVKFFFKLYLTKDYLCRAQEKAQINALSNLKVAS